MYTIDMEAFENDDGIVINDQLNISFSFDIFHEDHFKYLEYNASEDSAPNIYTSDGDQFIDEDDLIDEILLTIMNQDPDFVEDHNDRKMHRGIGAYRKNIDLLFTCNDDWNIYGLCELFNATWEE